MNPASFRVKDVGDRDRHLVACQALVDVLLTDPRVVTFERHWRATIGLDEAIRQVRAADARTRDEEQAAFAVGYDVALKVLSVILPPFVTKDLRLPYPWLALQLQAVFAARVA